MLYFVLVHRFITYEIICLMNHINIISLMNHINIISLMIHINIICQGIIDISVE